MPLLPPTPAAAVVAGFGVGAAAARAGSLGPLGPLGPLLARRARSFAAPRVLSGAWAASVAPRSWTASVASRALSTSSSPPSSDAATATATATAAATAQARAPPKQRRYSWIDAEAQLLIARAYEIHDPHQPFPPSTGLTSADLENLRDVPHYVPRTFSDRVALASASVLERLMGLFFRDKYDHHAVTLETVAAVPGFVAAMHRHLRSLRLMRPDNGWIGPLLEESLNERMHLLIWMQHCQPTLAERAFVMLAQASYVTFYGVVYAVSPATAHRAVGYLEEAAQRAYTEFLDAIDAGHIKNAPLPADSIAAKFYRLPPGSTLRDVVLRVRADEVLHNLVNHGLADQSREPGGADREPVSLERDLAENGEAADVKAKLTARAGVEMERLKRAKHGVKSESGHWR